MTTESSYRDEKKPRVEDLEIKDAQLIFNNVWADITHEVDEESIRFPKEIFWLNGAPGAGKGTNTRFIMQYRDFWGDAIVISDLLKSPEAKKRMDAGLLVGDREVFALLLQKLLDPAYANGAVVDGFPRTQVQVELLKLFYNKLLQMGAVVINAPQKTAINKPNFHIIVLFIDEAESVRRQLHRGQLAQEHNKKVEASEVGERIAIRPTDLDEKLAHDRYRTFKQVTYDALASLREIFYYHFINAQGTVSEVQSRIIGELKYQSSLELSQDTYNRINRIPIASHIVKHARQQLIYRLDDYESHNTELFEKVVTLIDQKFMPIIHKHAISGKAHVNSEDPLFEEPLAIPMLIDIFSERGYHATVDIRQEQVPERVDPKTHAIILRTKKVYRMRFRFQGSDIRRGA